MEMQLWLIVTFKQREFMPNLELFTRTSLFSNKMNLSQLGNN